MLLKSKSFKESAVAFAFSMLLLLLIAPIGMLQPVGGYNLGHSLLLVVAAVLFLFLTIWRLTKSENKTQTIVCIALPPALIFIPAHVLFFRESIVSLASAAFHFVGILFGVLIYFSKSRIQKIGLSSLLLLLCAGMYFKGNSLVLHKFNYGTFLGRINIPAPEFKLEDEQGNIYTNTDFKDKVLVVDFWTTSCGVCFRKFPIVEELYSKHKNRSDIIIVAVNNPLKGDTKSKAIDMIRERGYSFKIMFSELKSTNQNFEFNAYPTTFVINDGSEIIYKGGIEGVDRILN